MISKRADQVAVGVTKDTQVEREAAIERANVCAPGVAAKARQSERRRERLRGSCGIVALFSVAGRLNPNTA